MVKVFLYRTNWGIIIANQNNQFIYNPPKINYFGSFPDLENPPEVFNPHSVSEMLTPGKYQLSSSPDSRRRNDKPDPQIVIYEAKEIPLKTCPKIISLLQRLDKEYNQKTKLVTDNFLGVVSSAEKEYRTEKEKLVRKKNEKIILVRAERDAELAKIGQKPFPSLEELLK